jgi:hypothetical protein
VILRRYAELQRHLVPETDAALASASPACEHRSSRGSSRRRSRRSGAPSSNEATYALAAIRIGNVHVADAVRVGLDRFVVDALGSEALEERVEPRRRRR